MAERWVRKRRGATLPWLAASLMVMVGFVGLCIDMGYLYIATHQLQNVADASALAAAAVVRNDPQPELSHERANMIAQWNHVLGRPGWIEPDDVVIGRFNVDTATFTPMLEEGRNAVRVTVRLAGSDAPEAPGPVRLLFGSIFGVPEVELARTATAIVGGGTGAGLITLNSNCFECSLHVSGNATLNVDGGSVIVNSCHSCAMCVSSNAAVVDTSSIDVVGDICFHQNNPFEGSLNFLEEPVPDPLAHLPDLKPPYLPDYGAIDMTGGTTTIFPGYYPGGINLGGGAQLTMMPGIYVIGHGGGGGSYPAGLNVGGGSTLIGEGVMIYLQSGSLDIGSNANVLLTPPDPEVHSFTGAGEYEHVSIFQARSNTAPARMNGGPDMFISGALYFPSSSRLTLHGTGDGQFGNMIVAQNMYITGDVTVNYNGIFAAAAGHRLAIVE